MQHKTVLVTMPEEGIAQITMNRPEALNALSAAVEKELIEAMEEIEANDAVRVVVITGTGKAFIAGADISYMSRLTAEEACVFSAHTGAICERIRRSRNIYLAAINGFAFGAGCEISLACDICLASDAAKFGLPEVGLGILPGAGGTQRLSSHIGMQRAKEMIFTGDPIGAEEALRIGLVTLVVEAGQLIPEAYALAGRILKNAPLAVKYAKECMQHSEEGVLLPGIGYENTRFGLCFATADQKEGMHAFLEKRKPNFHKTF